jgi:amino acid transporter
MLGGAAFIFFAYIGFDAVSTTAEEAKNPGRDLPFGIIMSLAVCTVLYITLVASLNGMALYYKLNVAFPVAFAMNYVGLAGASVIISFGAIAGLTTVLLAMMFGQSRIFYAMSRDGLIPQSFTRIHPTWRTPSFSTLFFGICIAAIAAFTPINIVGSLTNMGTLAAFILASIAVPILRRKHPDLKGAFSVPGGPYIVPVLSAVTALGLIHYLKVGNRSFGDSSDRLAVVLDLAGRRARLLLRLRPPAQHGRVATYRGPCGDATTRQLRKRSRVRMRSTSLGGAAKVVSWAATLRNEGWSNGYAVRLPASDGVFRSPAGRVAKFVGGSGKVGRVEVLT